MHIIQLICYAIFGTIIWFSSTKTRSEAGKNTQLLMYKDGIVPRENFVYFSIEDEGNLQLNLSSIDGDADIYIAENSIVPTYEPGKYDLHSASCGDDIIDIPKSFKRPVIIGIYSNSVSETTNFNLRVERILSNKETTYSDFFEPLYSQEDQKNKNNEENNAKTTKKPNIKAKPNNKLDLKSFIFGVLEVAASAL